LVWAIKK